MSPLVVVGAAVVLFAGAAAWAEEPPTRVVVDQVAIEPLAQTIPILGRLVANQRGEVAARVEGAIERLEAKVGDRLAVGDVVALVDEARLRANLDLARARVLAAEAQIETDRADLGLLEQERARLQRLRDSAAFSAASLEDKVLEIQAARARIARSEALLDEARADAVLAERDLEDAHVLSPYPGVVTQRYVSAGDYVQIGEPVVSLIDDTSLEIEADVPSPLARALTADARLAVLLDGDPAFDARLRAVVPDENPLTRTLAVRLTIEGSIDDLVLAGGQSVTLEVPVGERRDVLTVDKDAILRRSDGAVVFVADDGAATPRTVRLGEAVGQRFIVEDGLEDGELVVVRGNERLRPNQPIAYDDATTTARPLLTGGGAS